MVLYFLHGIQKQIKFRYYLLAMRVLAMLSNIDFVLTWLGPVHMRPSNPR